MKKRVLAMILVMTMVFGMMIPSYGTSVGDNAEADDSSASVSDPVDESGEPTENLPAENDVPAGSGEEKTVVEALQAQIDALCAVLANLDISAMSDEETAALYEEANAIYDAMDALSVEDSMLLDVSGLAAALDALWGAETMAILTVSNATELANAVSSNNTVNLGANITTDITIPAGVEVILNLNGYTLTGSGTSSVITVNGTLYLKDSGGTGKVTGGKGKGVNVSTTGNATVFIPGCGGGVYVAPNGSFHLVEGSITGNTGDTYGSHGGGVFVDTGGRVKMYGGTITNNTARMGGGIYVYRGTFDMTGGQIRENRSVIEGGGVLLENSTYTVSDNSAIWGNTAGTDGGGVYVDINSTFTMNGGTIRNNTAANGGGVYIHSGSTFNLNGGTVGDPANSAGNTATSQGGGVYVDANSTFNLKGGEVAYSNNDGVYVTTNGTFAMTGGTVRNNTSHGVHINGSTTSSANAGTINNNGGRGVFVVGSGNFPLGGTVEIYSNDGGVYFDGGTNTMTFTGGTIRNNTATGNGGGVEVISGTFDMRGGTITSNSATSNGGGVYVGNGTFNLKGGEVAYSNNDGVYVTTNGTFAMTGGTVRNNTSHGVHINGSTTSSASGGIIRDNTGRGVYVSSGNFSLSGTAEIYGNDGGVYFNGGTLTMNGGTIRNNNAANGGGVSVVSGTFNMSGGTISNNTVTQNGGGVYVDGNNSRFTLSTNGTITGNTANVAGGGVELRQNGTFTMNGGTISGNTANGSAQEAGGGVRNNGATFVMTGGTIRDNRAPNGEGGGLCTYDYCTNTISGGSITGNSAQSGGGVNLRPNPSLIISGAPTIEDNTLTDGTTKNNVNIAAGKSITLNGALTGGYVGVSPANPAAGTVIAEGNDASYAASSAQYFHDDSDTYGVGVSTTTNTQLVFVASTAAEVYVSSTGNDTTGTGTRDHPFATIKHAQTVVTDGGTIYVMDNITQTDADIRNSKAITITTDPQATTQPAVVTLTIPVTASNDDSAFLQQLGDKTLTLSNITFQGDGTASNAASVFILGSSLLNGGTGNLTLGSGATIQNFTTRRGAVMTPGQDTHHSRVTMESGSMITGNTATATSDVAGGITMWGTGGTLTINGGTVSDNKGPIGGIFIHGTAAVKTNATINSGTITGNQSNKDHADSAGGITVKGNLTLSGTVNISGNSCVTGSNSNAPGGIRVGTTGSLTMSGAVSITNNTNLAGSRSNVFLPGTQTITLTGVVTGKVGVTQAGRADSVQFATSTGNIAENSRNVFFDDTYDYIVDYGSRSGNSYLLWGASGNVYISTNGDDANNGTRTNPVQTFTRAFALVSDGGTIYVMTDLADATSSNINNSKDVTITTDPVRDGTLCTIPAGQNAVVTLAIPVTTNDYDDAFLRQTGDKTLTLENITFQGNGTASNAASVFMLGLYSDTGSTGKLIMKSGATMQNFSTKRGVVMTPGNNSHQSQITMESGSVITGNTATETRDVAGGITMWGNGGTLTINGGTVSNNKGAIGGIFIYGNATISGGAITGNQSNLNHADSAGGISVKGSLTLSGTVDISNNSCTTASDDNAPGGIRVDATGSLTMSGAVSVTNNTNKAGEASNVWLPNTSKAITLAGDVTGTVGVTQIGTDLMDVVFARGADDTVTAGNSLAQFSHDGNKYRAAAAPGAPNDNSLIWRDPTRVYIKAAPTAGGHGGDDSTGLGTRQYPYLTFTKAFDMVQEVTSPNPAPGSVYVMSDLVETPTASITNNKNVLVQTDPTRDTLCTIPTGQFAIVNLDLSNVDDAWFIVQTSDKTLTLQDITFDGGNRSTTAKSVFSGGREIVGQGDSGVITLGANATIQSFITQRGAISTPGTGGSRGQVIINGGTITGNQADTTNTQAAGGITVWASGSLTINSGTITNNEGGQGGIYVHNGALVVDNATITGNIAYTNNSDDPGAGGIHVRGGSATITNSTITGNQGAIGGIATSVATTITNCTISNNISNLNHADAAGGISVRGNAANPTTIRGCTIQGNRVEAPSSGWGGGIFINENSSAIMRDADDGTGNTVTGNTCAGTYGDKAGGIHASGTLSLSGNVTVTGNTRGDGTTSNVSLNWQTKKITLAGQVTGSVGVSHVDAVSGTVFATGTDASWATASATNFFHDADTFGVSVNGGNLVWAQYVAQILQDNQTPVKYMTLSDAVNAYTSTPGTNSNGYIIQLLEDITTAVDSNVTINKAVYLDLARHNIGSPITVEAGGTLYGLDSGTNTYQKALTDANGDATYGQISGTVTGEVQTLSHVTQSGKKMNYVAVKEGNNWSFHRFNVQVSKFSFMIDTDYQYGEIWFYPTVQGNEKVMRALADLGGYATDTDDPSDQGKQVSLGADVNTLDANWTDNGRFTFKGMLQRLPYSADADKQRLLNHVFELGGYLTFTNPNGGNDVTFEGPAINYSFLQVLKIFYNKPGQDQTVKNDIDQFITDNQLTTEWGNV